MRRSCKGKWGTDIIIKRADVELSSVKPHANLNVSPEHMLYKSAQQNKEE